MAVPVPFDELLDSGRLDYLWDDKLRDTYGYTSDDVARFARVLSRPCPDCGAEQATRCRTIGGRELLGLDEQHVARRVRY